jgi:hypothetical protein
MNLKKIMIAGYARQMNTGHIYTIKTILTRKCQNIPEKMKPGKQAEKRFFPGLGRAKTRSFRRRMGPWPPEGYFG